LWKKEIRIGGGALNLLFSSEGGGKNAAPEKGGIKNLAICLGGRGQGRKRGDINGERKLQG